MHYNEDEIVPSESNLEGFVSELDFDAAIDALEELGLPTPETPASERIISTGDKSLHGVSIGQLFDAVHCISDDDDIVTTQDIPQPVSPPHDEAANVCDPSKARRRSSRKGDRIASYFVEINADDESNPCKFNSKCLQCDYVVRGTDTRYRLHHIYLCCNIPFLVRLGYYFMSSDKSRPPLLESPIRHCEPHQARIMVQKQTATLQELIEGHLSRRDDLSRDQSLARWLMAKADIKMNCKIDECSAEESRNISNLLMDYIVEENIPFATCGYRDGFPRPFGRLLNYLRPGYRMPAVNNVSKKMLDSYFQVVRKAVLRKVRNAIPDQCRTTIMFDGSEDVKGQPIINVLLRVMGSARSSTKTYFLKSVYTGYDTCDASYYVDMVEKVVKDFGGFESVAGVVTDNTGSVVNARNTLQQKYPGLVASQDQAHVADLLMSDIGEIPWIQETLQSITIIGTHLRRFRKLRQKLMELADSHNAEVRKRRSQLRQSRPSGGKGASRQASGHTEDDSLAREREEAGEVDGLQQTDNELVDHMTRDENSSDLKDDENSGTSATESDDDAQRIVTVNNILSPKIQMAVNTLRQGQGEDEDMVGPVADQLTIALDNERGSFSGDTPTFARMMKKVSSVRFASCEKLLYEYRSLRKLLLKLVCDVGFETWYPAKNDKERAERQRKFVGPIKDSELAQRVIQVHSIMRSCRIYLRMFDSETSLISEVYNATMEIERTIRCLPIECFPEPRKENREELIEVFRNRKEGPLPGRKRIRITLLSDLHIAAVMLDPYRCPNDISSLKGTLRSHMESYFEGSNNFANEFEKDEFMVEMMSQYDVVHSIWKARGYIKEGSEQTSTAEAQESKGQTSSRILRERSPMSWWTAGSLKLPRDEFTRKATKALVEFAVRTLSVSPTATATERTFSHLTRIQPLQRSGLSPEKVEKLLFCQWNLRVLRKVSNPYEVDIDSTAKKQIHGLQTLRAHRKNVSSLSYLSSLRSNKRNANQEGVKAFEPVTAQNKPSAQSGANNNASKETVVLDENGNEVGRLQGLRTSQMQTIVRDGETSSVTLRAFLRAAVEYGRSMNSAQPGSSLDTEARDLMSLEKRLEHEDEHGTGSVRNKRSGGMISRPEKRIRK